MNIPYVPVVKIVGMILVTLLFKESRGFHNLYFVHLMKVIRFILTW